MMPESSLEWIIPAAIPFEDLKGIDLEECVYWLLDEMGAKGLEWRVGGSGGGAADGGRDLEAHFFVPDDAGELIDQKWWVECKGRTGTLEASQVKSAVVNAFAYEGLDSIVIATNTQFSNPTRDWVKEWRKKNPIPVVRLWDKAQLERYLSRHPNVVLRLFSEALSIHGRMQALESRFWNKLEYVAPQMLADIWDAREEIELTPMNLFAATANEFASGDITLRPWGAIISSQSVIDVLATGLQNVPYLIHRSIKAGIDQAILFRSFAYLIIVALDTFPAKDIAKLVMDSLTRGEDASFPTEILNFLLMPILDQLISEMQDVCSEDCARISTNRVAITAERDEIEFYWKRLMADGLKEKGDSHLLRLEKHDAPCAVGFAVDKDNGCPLFAFEPNTKNVEELMAIIKSVAISRKAQAAAKWEAAAR